MCAILEASKIQNEQQNMSLPVAHNRRLTSHISPAIADFCGNLMALGAGYNGRGLACFYCVEYLDTLPVTNADVTLLSTRQPASRGTSHCPYFSRKLESCRAGGLARGSVTFAAVDYCGFGWTSGNCSRTSRLFPQRCYVCFREHIRSGKNHGRFKPCSLSIFSASCYFWQYFWLWGVRLFSSASFRHRQTLDPD